MLTEEQAIKIAKKKLPEGRIEAVVPYRDIYILQIFLDDPLEGDLDPFYSVHKDTGKFRDFSIFQDGNMPEIAALILKVKEGTK